jgi:hypothetical protein
VSQIKWIGVLLLFCWQTSDVQAQILRNVELTPRNTKILVSYQLVQDAFYPPDWRYDLSLSFIGKKSGRIRPERVTGELDSVVPDGKVRTLEWDAFTETGGIKDEIAAELRIRHMGGPEAAFCSVVLPGWGMYEVSGGNKQTWHRTAIVGGALIAGLAFQQSAYRQYAQYQSAVRYAEGQKSLGNANRLNQVGWVFLSAGLAYWLYDITEVAIRGAANARLRVTPLDTKGPTSRLGSVPALTLTWNPQ